MQNIYYINKQNVLTENIKKAVAEMNYNVRILSKEVDLLEDKIDKAIEYINKNKQIVSNLKCSAGCSPNEEPKEYNVYKLYCEPTELLEILGDDKNV